MANVSDLITICQIWGNVGQCLTLNGGHGTVSSRATALPSVCLRLDRMEVLGQLVLCQEVGELDDLPTLKATHRSKVLGDSTFFRPGFLKMCTVVLVLGICST